MKWCPFHDFSVGSLSRLDLGTSSSHGNDLFDQTDKRHRLCICLLSGRDGGESHGLCIASVEFVRQGMLSCHHSLSDLHLDFAIGFCVGNHAHHHVDSSRNGHCLGDVALR